ncbi:Aste57867_12386 [Aphanomyces stellatus]|uniref:Aste57867_12386 protein n=1 Tax=Aphanomyces stellatus TaxID=120398 RepID=A0A485KVW2_9STRA|nr:hypothetical protein As57867_012340 [Aphanomyces stellatus]VFT89237.1 Aste57867_12386 [Aphanomyces stellatus]
MGACASKTGGRHMDRWAAADGVPPEDKADGEDGDQGHGTIYFQENVSCVVSTTPGLCASGWDDGEIKLINYDTNAVVHSWTAHSRSVNKLLFAPATSTSVSDITRRSVGDVIFFPSLYSCSRDTTIARHTFGSLANDPTTPSPTAVTTHPPYHGHTLTVSALAINESESTLASGSRDTGVSLWDVATSMRRQHTITSQNIVTCMAWVPRDANVVAQGGEDLRVRLWDARAWKAPTQTIEGYIYFPLSIACSDDGHYLLTSSKGFNAVGCEGRVWDRRTGKQVAEMRGHAQDATACAYIPGRNHEGITASKDSSIRVWDTTTGDLLASTQDANAGMFTSVSCVPNDTTSSTDGVTRILTSSFAGRIAMYGWDSSTRRLELVS